MYKGFGIKGQLWRKKSHTEMGEHPKYIFGKFAYAIDICIFYACGEAYISITDLLTQLYLFEHKVINQLWRPPHLEHPKTLQHIYIYMYICIYIHIFL